jgi:hypothetical protein
MMPHNRIDGDTILSPHRDRRQQISPDASALSIITVLNRACLVNIAHKAKIAETMALGYPVEDY